MGRFKRGSKGTPTVYTRVGNREVITHNAVRWTVMYSNPLDVPVEENNQQVARFRLILKGMARDVSEEQMATVTDAGALVGTNAPPLVPQHFVAVHTPDRRVWIIAGMDQLYFECVMTYQELEEEQAELEEEQMIDDFGGGGQKDSSGSSDKRDDASSGGAAGILAQ